MATVAKPKSKQTVQEVVTVQEQEEDVETSYQKVELLQVMILNHAEF